MPSPSVYTWPYGVFHRHRMGSTLAWHTRLTLPPTDVSTAAGEAVTEKGDGVGFSAAAQHQIWKRDRVA